MWNKQPNPKSVIDIVSQIEYHDEYRDDYNYEMEIKRKLAHDLVNELLKGDFIEFMKHYHPERMTYEMKARAKVVDGQSNIKMVYQDDYFYEVLGKRFEHEKIEEAVKNTFPEYFL